jgi:hypothetical protein
MKGIIMGLYDTFMQVCKKVSEYITKPDQTSVTIKKLSLLENLQKEDLSLETLNKLNKKYIEEFGGEEDFLPSVLELVEKDSSERGKLILLKYFKDAVENKCKINQREISPQDLRTPFELKNTF